MSAEVMAALATLQATVDRLAHCVTPAVTVAELWASFAVANSALLASWRDYAQRWRDWVGPSFGSMDANAVAPGDVDAYRARRLAAHAAIATTNREIALLRRLINFGVRRALVTKSKVHGPGMTKELIHEENNARTTVIEEHAETGVTLAGLLRAAGPQLRAFILMVHHTGIRRWEAARVRPERIRNGLVWIPSKEVKGKKSGRTVPLSSAALAAIALLPPTQKYLFESRRAPGKPIHKDTWTHRFGRLVRRLGLEGPDGGPPWLHDLRRSFITLSRREGESERAIMNVSGHKTRAVFDRYDIHDVRDLLEFRARRELARLNLSGPRHGPRRAGPAEETNVLEVKQSC